MKNKFLYILALIALPPLLAFQMWLFYFAPCSTVKDFWVLTHVPGRCL